MKIFLMIFMLSAISLCYGQAGDVKTKNFDELKLQAKKAKNKHIVKYDKFDDYSLVSALPYDLISINERLSSALFRDYGLRSLWFGSGFTYTGKNLEENKAQFFLFFSAESVKPQFLRNSQLTILVDDKKYKLTPSDKQIEAERYYGEFLGFMIDKNILQEIVEAKDAEMKVGDYVQVLKKNHKEMIADTLKLANTSIVTEKKNQ